MRIGFNICKRVVIRLKSLQIMFIIKEFKWTMTEWQSITNLNVDIPDDEPEVTISNYKTVKKKSGIYKIYNQDGKLMYIGQTENLRRRLNEHFTEKRKGYFIETVRFFYVDYDDEFITKSYLDMYETYLIRKLKPRYNVQQTAPMRYI